jgi:hypothetical protein
LLSLQATGHCHNSLVQACGLILHDNELADDLSQPHRTLRYLPRAVLVRPVENPLDAPSILDGVAGADSTEGVFAILPSFNKERNVRGTNITAQLRTPSGEQTTTVRVLRYNIALGDAYAVTDYFCQGRTFGLQVWLADLTVPPNGIDRATWFVILSRFRDLNSLHLLRPLYTSTRERERVIDALVDGTDLTRTQPGRDLLTELHRLCCMAHDTVQR